MIFPTTASEISALIHGFKDGRSPGYDGITNTVLKHISMMLLHSLYRTLLTDPS